ncbi:histidine kinase dimerization/phospho-acceptor domain-containing protein [Bradyrhizobium sp.]|uniref:histidine kinase dimerization/phospho-acceptor domain-containing protein n=1 Tax=Bradyrhizobium sp. TaxID=376 RepID=UPI003BAE99D1
MALEDIVIGDRQTSISPILAKHLFETSLDLIMITDRHGQFIEISPSSMTILGYRPDEMTGRNGIRFIYPDDLDRTRNEMRPSASRRADAELRDPLHAQGSIMSLAWSGVWSESDQLHFFIGRDVTTAKLMERLKNEFVATMSHELGTPLTSIAGALGLLVHNAEAMPASALRLLTIAKANCQRLVRLVSGILDLDEA